MSKPVIVSLIGARPQFIKIASLAKKLSSSFSHIIIHSGQHYDYRMSEIFFEQLDIPRVKYNLSVGSGSHGEMTAEIMKKFEKQLIKIKPDFVLVYGDTNSTLAGALTASKMRLPIGHVEAGLRSFDMNMPEEINRKMTDHVSSLLFCPTLQAVKNLKTEGIKKGIVRSGDLMYELIDNCRDKINGNSKILAQHNLTPNNYVLFTLHRAGTVDIKLNLRKALRILEELDIEIFFPIHPRTLKNFKNFQLVGRLKAIKNLHLSKPVSYLDNLTLIANARAVLTDSGGLQKEAVFLKTPCLTMRQETEWVETIGKGNQLVGLSLPQIEKALESSLRQKKKYFIPSQKEAPSDIIVSALKAFLK
ncbi:MAG: UDP-N-acetylglucosamine 2-epimerase (non-hydrolyzing) [Candidatus Zixiibacteriota bacterium]